MSSFEKCVCESSPNPERYTMDTKAAEPEVLEYTFY